MHGLHKINLFVALDLSNQMDLSLNLSPPPHCDNPVRIIQNHFLLIMHFDLLQEFIHKEVCSSFKGTYTDLFKHTEMTK